MFWVFTVKVKKNSLDIKMRACEMKNYLISVCIYKYLDPELFWKINGIRLIPFLSNFNTHRVNDDNFLYLLYDDRYFSSNSKKPAKQYYNF